MIQQKLTNITENANVNTVSDDNHISESIDAEINIISNSIPPVPSTERRVIRKKLNAFACVCQVKKTKRSKEQKSKFFFSSNH
jgi:hypothetical protein